MIYVSNWSDKKANCGKENEEFRQDGIEEMMAIEQWIDEKDRKKGIKKSDEERNKGRKRRSHKN